MHCLCRTGIQPDARGGYEKRASIDTCLRILILFFLVTGFMSFCVIRERVQQRLDLYSRELSVNLMMTVVSRDG